MGKNIKNKGITLPDGDDSKEKSFKEKTKALYENYLKSEQIEKDFKNLKSSDRLQFLQKMSPYFIPKDSEAVNKLLEEAEKRRRAEDVKKHRQMYYYDEYPDDACMTDDKEETQAYLDEFYANLEKQKQKVRDKEREWQERDRRIRAKCECALNGSNKRLKKMFDSYVNSKLFEHDFDKLNSTERIKFIQEMSSYFIQKKGLEYYKEIIKEADKEEAIKEANKEVIGSMLLNYPLPDDDLPDDFRDDEEDEDDYDYFN